MKNCHRGPCDDSDDCRKKVKLTCECKTRKVDYSCDKVRAEHLTTIDCDDNCIAKKKQIQEQHEQEQAKKLAYEEEKNKRELELYEKKFGKKKHKERKVRVVEETKDNTKLILTSVAVSVVLIAVILYFTII